MHLPQAPAPPLPPSARRATGDDLADLERLHRAAVAGLAGVRGGEELAAEVARDEVGPSLRHDLAAPDRGVLVGCLGSEPVGHAVLELHAGRPGELVELWVEPAARAVGVGHALLEQALEMARAAGCTGLDARALPGDRATKNFFEDHAMVARSITVHTGFGVSG